MPIATIRELAQENAGATPTFIQPLPLSSRATSKTSVIISCVDPRADPKDFWGIRPGMPPGIVRNAGGRAADALRTLEVLNAMGKGLEVVAVVHHTHCGVGPHGMSDAYIRSQLPGRMNGGSEEDIADKNWNVYNHQSEEDSVKEDMRLILEDKLLPENVQVLGFVLDIDTNKTREVFL